MTVEKSAQMNQADILKRIDANWDKLERESIQSTLGFVEQLLLEHFS